jgi:hypothetical protein
VDEPPATTGALDAPRERPECPWGRSWALSLAVGLAVLMVACGLSLAFGWVQLERALDVRALFR